MASSVDHLLFVDIMVLQYMWASLPGRESEQWLRWYGSTQESYSVVINTDHDRSFRLGGGALTPLQKPEALICVYGSYVTIRFGSALAS